MPPTVEQQQECLTKGNEMSDRHVQEVKDQVPRRYQTAYATLMMCFIDLDTPTRKLLIKQMSETQAHIDECDLLDNANPS